MKKLSIALATAALLSACGGGSDVAPAPADSASSPAQASTPVSASPAQLVVMPPVPVGAVRMSVGSLTQGGNAAEWNISFNAAVNMTVSGALNKMWVSAAAPGGSATITGNQNTIVFLPGTVTTVNVSGSGNIFYLAEGSPIKIEGTGAAASTVNYYKS